MILTSVVLCCLSCTVQNKKEKENYSTQENKGQSFDTEYVERPKKSIIRNLSVDTSQVFGIWVQDPSAPHAEFWIQAEKFLIVDYDGDGSMPYILDGNTITIFLPDYTREGIITSTENNTLKIKWKDSEEETTYIPFKN